MKTYLDTDLPPFQIQYFDELPLWSAPFGLKLLEYVQYKKGISVLDIGFGSGFPLIELAMRMGETAIVYGIDPWQEAIARVKEKLAYNTITNVHILEGVAEAIPLDDASIDLIVSNNGMNNVQDVDQAFSECARIAKPGAQLVITMNLDKSMFEFYTQLEHVLTGLKLDEAVARMHEHIYHKRRPLTETISRIERHGFLLKDLEHDQFCFRFADATAMFNHAFVRRAFLPPWKSILPGKRTEEIFDTIESRLNAIARHTGALQLSIPFVVINAIKG